MAAEVSKIQDYSIIGNGRSAALISKPGFLGLHYGIRTPLTVLVAHVIFGIILGTFYVVK
jgi:hypothetical protein